MSNNPLKMNIFLFPNRSDNRPASGCTIKFVSPKALKIMPVMDASDNPKVAPPILGSAIYKGITTIRKELATASASWAIARATIRESTLLKFIQNALKICYKPYKINLFQSKSNENYLSECK